MWAIEILDEKEKTGNLMEILPRKNTLIRPAVANVDQALVIFAVNRPKPNFNLLDHFLVMMEYQKVKTVICFNKEDLSTKEELEELQRIYAGCESQVLFVSAGQEKGMEAVHEILKGKTTTVARALRRGKIHPHQPDLPPGLHGDRGDQQEDRPRKTYHPPFRAFLCGRGHLSYGYAGVQFPDAS